MISLWIALTIIYWKCSTEMKCEISLLSRLTSESPTAASPAQHSTSLLPGEQSTTEPSASAVLSIKDELKKMGAATGLPGGDWVLHCGSEDYIIFILLACNSPLQAREKKDRRGCYHKDFIVIIYRYRNITTLLAGRSYISINHSKLLPTTKLQSALQLSMRTFTLEGFLVDLLSIKNPKQIVEITDLMLLD